MPSGVRLATSAVALPYRPILNDQGIQIGYADGNTAYNLHGKMLYHLDKDGALLRPGDAKVVGTVREGASGLVATGETATLCS